MFTNAKLMRLILVAEGIFIQGLLSVDSNVVGYQLSRPGSPEPVLSPLVVEQSSGIL